MHLYERIYDDLKRSILEGEERPGDRLPSIREVALSYGCNKLTAQKAFDLLAAEGLVENRVGAGSFVVYPSPVGEGEGDFSAARLGEDFFPYEAAGALLSGILATARGQVFSASPLRGERSLLSALARRFSLPEASLLVTGGGLQSLDLCRRLFPSPARILVEEPCFPAALSLFRPAATLPMGPGGPDPGGFAEFFSKPGPSRSSSPGVFYAVPDVHNPTGLSYSEEVKRELARLAKALEVWIVEDDYLSELEPSGLPRFVDLVPERTIWIKSLSRTTAPGIRIGALASPAVLRGRVEALKAEVEPGPAAWLQLFAEALISSGLFDQELASTVTVLKRRRHEVAHLLARHRGLSWDPGARGYNLWVTSQAEPSHAAPPWAPGRRFGYSPELRRQFRLSLMALGEAQWPRALDRLGLALDGAFGALGAPRQPRPEAEP